MGWTFLDSLIPVTGYITADSTWRITTTITELASDATVIWLRTRQSDTGSKGVGATHPDITSTTILGLGHVNKPQYFMVGVKNQTFRYYCSDKTNMTWEILAYGTNANEAYNTAGAYPNKSPSVTNEYQDRSFNELPAGTSFAALMVDQNFTYPSGFRHDGATFDKYYYKVNDSITTVFCQLDNNVGEIKVGHVAYTPCYLTAGLVNGAVPFSAPQAITVSATGWQTIDASAIFPAGANVAILECRNINTASARLCALRNTGSADNITIGVNIQALNPGPCSQFRLVGLNASRQFDINVGNTTDILVEAYGYISNEVALRLTDYWPITIGMLELGEGSTSAARESMYIEIEIR